jgi:hypothetical protein
MIYRVLFTISSFIVFQWYFLIPAYAQILSETDIEPYVWHKQVVQNISPEADDLRQELSVQVKKMIDAGHLAPYRFTASEVRSGVVYFWELAGEPIYALSEAYRYLPEEDESTRKELLSYMQNEIAHYPPYKATQVYNQVPAIPRDSGVRREWYMNSDYQDILIPSVEEGNTFDQDKSRIQTLYHFWNYVDATGDTSLLSNNWSNVKNLFDVLKNRKDEDKAWMYRDGCIHHYGDIVGCIGMARMAYLMNDQVYVDQAITRATQGFNAGLDFEQVESNAGDYKWMSNDSNPSAYFATMVYLDIIPETARFIRDKVYSDSSSHILLIAESVPTWFLVNSPGFYAMSELNRVVPLVSYPLFQAHAQILQKDPEYLRDRLDVPLAKVGDLYYIHNLISTIKAYGDTCWEDLRTETIECPEIPNETRCAGDITKDGQVNISDLIAVIRNWSQPYGISDLIQVIIYWGTICD